MSMRQTWRLSNAFPNALPDQEGVLALKIMPRGVGAMERVHFTPRVLTIEPPALSPDLSDDELTGDDRPPAVEASAAEKGAVGGRRRKHADLAEAAPLGALRSLPVSTAWVSLRRNIRVQVGHMAILI